MYKILLLLICFPLYAFGQASNPNLINANLVLIATQDRPGIALDQLVTVLIYQNFYIQEVNKDNNIIHAYKLVDSPSGKKFIVQAVVTYKNITNIRLTGHYAISGEDGTQYYEARNSKRVNSGLETEAYTNLRKTGMAYPNSVLSFLVTPTATDE